MLFPFFADAYARAIGQLMEFDGFRSLDVKYFRPVMDTHQIFHHPSEAMVATLFHESGREPVRRPFHLFNAVSHYPKAHQHIGHS